MKTFAQIVLEYRQHRRYILAALKAQKEKLSIHLKNYMIEYINVIHTETLYNEIRQ